jgi:hypothetical protein
MNGIGVSSPRRTLGGGGGNQTGTGSGGPDRPSFRSGPLARLFVSLVVAEAILLIIDQILLWRLDTGDAIDDGGESMDAKWFLGIMIINLVFFLYLSISATFQEVRNTNTMHSVVSIDIYS